MTASLEGEPVRGGGMREDREWEIERKFVWLEKRALLLDIYTSYQSCCCLME